MYVCESRPQENDYSMGSASIEKAAATNLSSSPRGGVNVEHIFLGDESNLAEDNNIITSGGGSGSGGSGSGGSGSGSGMGGDNNLDNHSTSSQFLPSKITLIAYIHTDIQTHIHTDIHTYKHS